jgi:hypothetical protein
MAAPVPPPENRRHGGNRYGAVANDDREPRPPGSRGGGPNTLGSDS